MILPWLQVEQEAFERAVELAAVLEIGEAQALGHLVWLWRWALSRPADTDLTGLVSGPTAIAQIEAGARWKGERGALVAALAALGLASAEDTAHRVKGLDRYREQLQKRAQERERKANWKERSGDAEETRKERGKDRPVQRQSQTQSQTQSQRSTSSPLQALRAGESEDKNTRWLQEAEAFVTWGRAQAPALNDPGPKVREWARAFFAKHQPADPELIRVAFAKFLIWCHQAGKTVGWGLWMSDAVWEPRWAEVRADAQAKRGAA